MRFGPEGAEPWVLTPTTTHAVGSQQRLKIEREPVCRERHRGVVVIGIEGLLLVWVLVLGLVRGRRLGEGVDEVVVDVEGGVVVADGGHDGYVAVVGRVVGGSYTCEGTLSVVVLESVGGVEGLGAGLIVVGGGVGLLLPEVGGTRCLLRAG